MIDAEIRRRYRLKYEFAYHYGAPRHTWSAVGAKGAVHLHITAPVKEGDPTHGGIELHYRQPPRGMEDIPPSHDDCGLLHQPCWHDGSSLQAEEYWIPLWRQLGNDHAAMLTQLAGHADKMFEDEDAD